MAPTTAIGVVLIMILGITLNAKIPLLALLIFGVVSQSIPIHRKLQALSPWYWLSTLNRTVSLLLHQPILATQVYPSGAMRSTVLAIQQFLVVENLPLVHSDE